MINRTVKTTVKKAFSSAAILLCGFMLVSCDRGKSEGQSAAPAPVTSPVVKENPAIPVEVGKSSRQTIEEKISGNGTFYSKKQVNLSPKVGGRLLYIAGDVGDKVEMGDVMFRIDEIQYRLNLERAEAALAEVKSREIQARAALKQAELDLAYKKLDLERHRNLLKTETIAQYIYDQVKSAYEISTANRESAKAQIDVIHSTLLRTEKEIAITKQNLDDTVVRAPFSGIVTQKKANVEEMVQPGMVVISLEQTDEMELWIETSSSYLAKIHIGTPLYYLPDGWDEWRKGTVGRIDPKVNEKARTVRIAAIVNNPNRQLVPGLFAKTEIVVAVYPEAVTVPSVAIVRRGDEKTVFTVVDNQASPKSVTTGYEVDGLTVIRSGLDPGESIILSGHTNLKGGEKVTVSRREQL